MRILLLLLTTSILLLNTKQLKAQSYKRDIEVHTFKNKGEVKLVITGSNIDSIQEVVIQRGTSADEALRQIKILSSKELMQLKNAPLIWIDKFPLSGTTNMLYRAVVTYKQGYQKLYPAIETRIDSTYTN